MIKNDKKWQMIKKQLVSTPRTKIKVGFLSGNRYPASDGGLQVATVAAMQEQGTESIPPRSFIREGTVMPIRAGRHGVKRLMKQALYRSTIKGTPLNIELKLAAKTIEGVMRDSIRSWSIPPNAPSTIKSKGFNDPLVDSRLMLDSVESRVERK